MVIETTKGPLEESELDREDVVVDDEKLFARDVVYRLKGTAEQVCRMRGYHFEKKPPAEADPVDGIVTIEENGVRSTVVVGDLERKIVVVDTPDYFNCAIEYRRPGSDVIVHRSVNAAAKKGSSMTSEQGSVL